MAMNASDDVLLFTLEYLHFFLVALLVLSSELVESGLFIFIQLLELCGDELERQAESELGNCNINQ